MKSLRNVKLIFICTVIALISACSKDTAKPKAQENAAPSASSAASTPGASKDLKGELTVWKFGSPQKERDYIAEMSKKFEEKNPGATVKIEYPDFNTRMQVIQTAFNGKNLPDVIIIENGMVPDLANGKIILPLDDIDANRVKSWSDNFAPELWKLGVYNNKTYGYSTFVDMAPMLMYNTEMFQKANLTPPATWEEVLADAAKLKTADVYGIAFAGSNATLDMDMIEGIAATNGGKWLDEKNGKIMLGGNGFKDTFDYVKKLQASGPTGVTQVNFRGSLQLFFQNKAAMVITKSFAPLIQDDTKVPADFPAKMIPFPAPSKKTGEQEPISFYAQGANFMAITSQVKHKDLAMEYLSYWADPATQQGWDGSKVIGRIPTAKKLLESEGFAKTFPVLADEYKQGTLFKKVESIPSFPSYLEDQAELISAFQKVLTNAASPADALNAAQEKAQKNYDNAIKRANK